MNSEELMRKVCRICLDENVITDWNELIYDYTTYKECYYKYTQLKCLAVDSFSPMLCQICVNGLQSAHVLFLKAIESHKYFMQDANLVNLQIEDYSNIRNDMKYTQTEFETVLVEKLEVEPVIQDHFVYDMSSDEEFNAEPIKTKDKKRSKNKLKNHITKKIVKETVFEEILKTDNTELNLNIPLKKTRKSIRTIKFTKQAGNNAYTKDESTKAFGGEFFIKNEDGKEKVVSKVKRKYKEIKKPRMCSICSKILHNKYAVQMHERTHIENRERKETCKVCGLKFYDKRNLYSHKRIHKENREKSHKCEFCNKAFYDKGGLNIHRRIHLGQMIPCTLCPKQYFRQIDLDRHMDSHSATTINSDTKKRSRYFVRCKHCDKSILSTSFKSHTAAHLNEPLMKCSICNKEFFRRGSCVLHVKKAHQKTNEEYNDFIIQYKKNRISHLFLEQKADIQFTNK